LTKGNDVIYNELAILEVAWTNEIKETAAGIISRISDIIAHIIQIDLFEQRIQLKACIKRNELDDLEFHLFHMKRFESQLIEIESRLSNNSSNYVNIASV
jgi:hypothetical protein